MAIQERPLLLLERGKSLADAAHDEMRALIENGSWSPRSRLPSETELVRRFGMSRPIIRQALAKMREAGLIQSRQGSGSFVLGAAPEAEPALPAASFPPIASLADLESFLSFREGVEGEAAAMAALHHSEVNLAELRTAVARLGADRPLPQLQMDDFAFHLAVARTSGNAFYSNTLNSLREHVLLGMGLTWNFSAGRADFRELVMSQHLAVVAAIERRDEEGARAAMRDHLRWARARLQTGPVSAGIAVG